MWADVRKWKFINNSLVLETNVKWGCVDYGPIWWHAAIGKSTAPSQVASNAIRTMALARGKPQVNEGQVWRESGRHVRRLAGTSGKVGRICERRYGWWNHERGIVNRKSMNKKKVTEKRVIERNEIRTIWN